MFIKQALSFLAKGLEGVNRSITELNHVMDSALVLQRAMRDFRLSISIEKSLFEYVIYKSEQYKKMSAKSPNAVAEFEKLLSDFGHDREKFLSPMAESCFWRKIIKPSAVYDSEVQARIDAEFESAMQERSRMILDVRNRCQNDPEFEKFFIQGMKECKIPTEYVMQILPKSLYLHLEMYGRFIAEMSRNS